MSARKTSDNFQSRLSFFENVSKKPMIEPKQKVKRPNIKSIDQERLKSFTHSGEKYFKILIDSIKLYQDKLFKKPAPLKFDKDSVVPGTYISNKIVIFGDPYFCYCDSKDVEPVDIDHSTFLLQHKQLQTQLNQIEQQLIQIKDNKEYNHETKQTDLEHNEPEHIDIEYNILDEQFNVDGYFSLSNDKKTASFVKASDILPNLHDYRYYPACRISKPIEAKNEQTQTVKFKLFQYGWYGIGSDTVTPHGFPGYTNSGWMIRVSNGGSWSNDQENAVGYNQTDDLTNQMITMKYIPNMKQLTVITEKGKEWVYTHDDMPISRCAYFVFTMASGKVQIIN